MSVLRVVVELSAICDCDNSGHHHSGFYPFVFQKKLREKLCDSEFMRGPLKKLKWKNWTLAVCRRHPKGYRKGLFKTSRSLPNASLRQTVFKNDISTQCIYELGVRFPEKTRRKIYVLHFRANFGTGFHVHNRAETLTIIRDKQVRRQIERLVRDGIQIFLRCAIGTERSVKLAVKSIHKKFDYAWGWRKRDFREIKKHGVILSTSWQNERYKIFHAC